MKNLTQRSVLTIQTAHHEHAIVQISSSISIFIITNYLNDSPVSTKPLFALVTSVGNGEALWSTSKPHLSAYLWHTQHCSRLMFRDAIIASRVSVYQPVNYFVSYPRANVYSIYGCSNKNGDFVNRLVATIKKGIFFQ